MEGKAERKPIRLGIVGYGEVGHAIAAGLHGEGFGPIAVCARDPNAAITRRRAAESGAGVFASPLEVAQRADLILNATQGYEALNVARAIASGLRPHHLYVDLTAASPRTKEEIAAILGPTGAQLGDGAIEGSPLHDGLAVPIMASGPAAVAFRDALVPWGMNVKVVGPELGLATKIKSLRAVMQKGFIALAVEWAVIAERYGLRDIEFNSVGEWHDGQPFVERIRRVVQTSTVHAKRRGIEAAESCELFEEAGLEPIMTAAAARLFERVEALGLRERLDGEFPKEVSAAIELLDAAFRPAGNGERR